MEWLQGLFANLKFPSEVLPTPDYTHLKSALEVRCKANNLQATEYFIMKTIQLYETIVVRHGVMTVGQPFSGKSCALRMLAGALTDLAEANIQVGRVVTGLPTLPPQCSHHSAFNSTYTSAEVL